MKTLKKTDNLTFTANYADGEKREIEEGILFEFEGDSINMHFGTDRVACLFSVVEAAYEAIVAFGLADKFDRYLEAGKQNQPEVKVVP